MNTSEALQQKVADCLKLFLKYNGRSHHLIEREMRELGYKFSRRILYSRRRRGNTSLGWIDRYKWNDLVYDLASAPPPNGNETFKEWCKRVSPNLCFDWAYQQVLF